VVFATASGSEDRRFESRRGMLKVLGVNVTMLLFTTRVTRLGEFSPIGRLFNLGSFENFRSRAKFLGYFFLITRYVLILAKQGLDCTLGDFFTNFFVVILSVHCLHESNCELLQIWPFV
jgi:hypothetical protein